MAIVQEHFEVNGRQFIRTYSDKGVLIHGGFPEEDYEEGLDPADLNRTYVETDIPIEGRSEMEEKAEAFDIIFGGEQ